MKRDTGNILVQLGTEPWELSCFYHILCGDDGDGGVG